MASQTHGNGGGEEKVGPDSMDELRADQVQNAVGFLSHPKVRGSSKDSKVAFLRGKGLTDAEIEEAFRRVPDDPIVRADVPVTATIPDSPSTPQAVVPHVGPVQANASPGHSFSWVNIFLGAGFVAAASYSIKTLLWPVILKTWKQRQNKGGDNLDTRHGTGDVLVPSESIELAKAIKEQTEQMRQSIESLQEMLHQKQQSDSGLSELRKEIRQLSDQVGSYAVGKAVRQGGGEPHSEVLTGGEVTTSGRHPVSYMEVLEMLEKGERPPGIRDDINDKAPNPDIPPPPARMKPVPKPWERSGDEASFSIDSNNHEASVSSISMNLGENERRLAANEDVPDRATNGTYGTPTSIFESATSPLHSPPIITERNSARMDEMGLPAQGLHKQLEFEDASGSQWFPPPVPQSSIEDHSND